MNDSQVSLVSKLGSKVIENHHSNGGLLVFGLMVGVLDALFKNGSTMGVNLLVLGLMFIFIDSLFVVIKHFVSKR